MSDGRQGMFHHCLGALKLKFQFTKFQLLSLETETLNDDPVFPFNSFKAKVPECCCALCTGVLDPMHIATSARPDLLHCVAWRLHRLRRTRYMVTPDKIKFRAPWAACVEIQAMPAPCRHVGSRQAGSWQIRSCFLSVFLELHVLSGFFRSPKN